MAAAGTHEDKKGYVDNYTDVTVFGLSEDREATLLDKQTECTFMWTNAQGEPVGVIMNYIWRKSRIWLTATRQRKRIAAIEARPRVSIAISSRGTNIGVSQSITFKGTAVIHDDEATKQWMYQELASAVRPDPDQAAAFAEHLANSPGRIVIEVILDKKIGFDSDAMFKNSPAGATRTLLD